MSDGEVLDLAEDLEPVLAGVFAALPPGTLKLSAPVECDPLGGDEYQVTIHLEYRPAGWPEEEPK